MRSGPEGALGPREVALVHGRPVRIEIEEILIGGCCPIGLSTGDTWVVDSAVVPEGMCSWAFAAMHPFLSVLRFGGRLPWEVGEGTRVCCPDSANPVVFRLIPVGPDGRPDVRPDGA